MNTKLFKTTVVLILLAFISVNAGGDNTTKQELIEQNLLTGIQSDNDGLRISSAFHLGEMKSEKAVNYLMSMLRDDENVGARLMAALSLIKIENEQGLYMVKRTAKFNTNERVCRMSDKLYYAHLISEYIKENPNQAPLFAGLMN